MFVLAFGANAWILGLEFQNDDYREIPSAAVKLGLERAPADVAWAEALRTTTYSYRPALWATLLGLKRLSGPHPEPWIFHAFFLTAHAFASVLVWRLLGSRAGPAAALIGGAALAVLPGGIQAASWVAAGGDQLAVLFMLLAGVASDRVLRERSTPALVACGVAVACATLAKETAVALLPALALLWIAPPAGAPRSGGRIAGLAVAAGAGALVAWTLRASALGTWTPMYWSGEWTSPLGAIGRLPTALRGFLVPWHAPGATPDLDPVVPRALSALGLGAEGARGAFTVLVCGAFVLPVALGFLFATACRRVTMLALLALGLLVILPVLPVTADDGVEASRALYPSSLILAVLEGCAAREIAARGPRWPIAFAPLFVLSLDLLVHVARTERFVAGLIRTARSDLRAVLDCGDGARVLLITPPEWIRSVPFLGERAAASVSPPFGDPCRVPLSWPTAERLKWCPPIREDPAPFRVLEWDGHGIRDRHPPLAAIPPLAPALEQDRADPGLFRPASAIPPRGLAGIRIEVDAGPGERASGTVQIRAGDHTRDVRFDSTGNQALVLPVPDDAFDEAWLRVPSVDSVRVVGARLSRAPVLVLTFPPIAIQRPETGRLSMASPPMIAFRTDAPAAGFRITIAWLEDAGPLALSWLMSAAAGADGQGAFAFVADGLCDVRLGGRDAGRRTWSEISAHFAEASRNRLWSVPIGLRIEALDASGASLVARSDWLVLRLVR